MKNLFAVILLCTAVAIGWPNATDLTARAEEQAGGSPDAGDPADVVSGPALDPLLYEEPQGHQTATARLQSDLVAMQRFSPSYPFWYHVFTRPDGSVAFGSATNGRLLVTFPERGNWTQNGRWEDPSLAGALDSARLPSNLRRRREEVADRLRALGGPVLHNPTRGLSLQRNAEKYGAFLDEWGAIYERFGVPANIGLAQAAVESGLSGTVRSRARAIGFCQWLMTNWTRLKRLSPHVIEGYNQTTQAPYCAAYLTILATKYGSFIPALSEHHAGAANVGRALINGERLGGGDVRERYFLGAAFARDLRTAQPRTFRDLYGTFGPRSALYAEMTFGNMANVERLRSTMPQVEIFAMRTRRARSLAEVAKGAGVSTAEAQRFNPALKRQVPSGGTVYLPRYVEAFGPDVSFWHRPPSEGYVALLNEFMQLDVPLGEWDARAFDAVLRDFQKRFAATKTEEGTVMATTLAFVLQDQRSSRQAQILAEFRTSPRILRLFERGKGVWNAFVAETLGAS
ncbi:MAG: hypothetical protein O2930_15255 [Acidobacteria bacterium]|nr:hypothetical protein [Acidobacteriota bacterium]